MVWVPEQVAIPHPLTPQSALPEISTRAAPGTTTPPEIGAPYPAIVFDVDST
jgi:hypothetical protein